MSALVRVTAPRRHEGVILCADHLREFAVDVDVAHEDVPADLAMFWGHRCLMCGVDEAPGRCCENPDCRRALHPRWPAVYCSNDCALEDL
ncbi:MAG TPA: hypothetical protein VLE97_11450 [Gaiellaceae bacterium]|nr:hypothetical protein [Gaiellaceae bacterium]